MAMMLNLPNGVIVQPSTGLPVSSILVRGPNAHPAISGGPWVDQRGYRRSHKFLARLNDQIERFVVHYYRFNDEEKVRYAHLDLQALLWIEPRAAQADQAVLRGLLHGLQAFSEHRVRKDDRFAEP